MSSINFFLGRTSFSLIKPPAPEPASLPTYRYPHTSHIVQRRDDDDDDAIGERHCIVRRTGGNRWLPYLETKTTQQNFPRPSMSFLPSRPTSHITDITSLTLDRHQQLQHVGVGRPGLGALAAPRAEQGDAHLAVLVEVRVEAVGAVAVVVADGRRLRVVRRQLEIEEEEAVLVRGARRARDHDGVEVLRGKRVAEEL